MSGADEETLLKLVPVNGPAGNVHLLNKLKEKGWDEKRYWDVRERLLEEGKLEKGRGRGGSVRRPKPKL
jgi:type I restriction enzyme M protein